MSPAGLLAVAAASLQLFGYLTYVERAIRGQIEPNPTSWLMWAYGTGLVVVLQADRGVGAVLLLLPTACAVCSLIVAWLCWRRGSLTWPKDGADQTALGMDLAATAAYLAVSALAATGYLAVADASGVKAFLLACVVTSTVVSFAPIIRTTRRDPSTEDALPWILWTSAYATLLAATWAKEGMTWGALASWAYPALCMGCSAVVGWLAVGMWTGRGLERGTRRRGNVRTWRAPPPVREGVRTSASRWPSEGTPGPRP